MTLPVSLNLSLFLPHLTCPGRGPRRGTAPGPASIHLHAPLLVISLIPIPAPFPDPYPDSASDRCPDIALGSYLNSYSELARF